MGTTENIEAVRRLETAYNAGDNDAVRSIVAEDLVPHTPGSENLPPGVEGAIAANEMGRASFPDKKTEILDIFAEADRVVTRIRFTGTNEGGLQWAGIPANGKKVDIEHVQISRHDDSGRIVETWAQMDVPKLMVQLGAMPAPEGM